MLKRFKLSDDFIRHGSWMFIATSLGSLFNLFYQLYMVRHLTPVDYGILNSLLALLLVISVPAGTLQTAITKFISSFHAHNQWKKIKIFLFQFTKIISLFAIVFFLIIALSSRYISSFLHIPSTGLVVMVGLLMLISLFLPLGLGGLQGLQMFSWLGLSGIISGALKLGIGIVLVGLGFRVMGALSSYIIATVVILLLSFIPLRGFLSEKLRLPVSSDASEAINFGKVYKYFLPVAITFLCFMALVNGDVILVKHFFSPLQAGYYSIAQMVGKIILFLPGPITMVMFPKASNFHAQNKDTRSILKKGLGLAGGLSGTAALVCVLFPALIIRLLSGKEYAEAIPLVWLFAVAMTFFALMYTLLFYQLSIHRLNFIYPLVFFTALQIILIIFFHKTLAQVLYILCGISILLFVTNLWLIRKAGEQI